MALVYLMLVGIPLPSDAQVPITVNINGTIKSGTDCVDITGQYTSATNGNIEIVANGGQNPKVGASCTGTDADANNDRLRFLNAIIRPLNTAAVGPEHSIQFWGTYNNLPTSTASGYWYKLSGSGSFRRGTALTAPAATSATVKAWGWYEYPSNTFNQISGSFLSKTIGFTAPFFGVPPLSQPVAQNTVQGPRQVKAELKFKFVKINPPDAATDELRLDNTGILVYDDSAPGEGGGITGIHVLPPGREDCPADAGCVGGRGRTFWQWFKTLFGGE